MSITVRVVMSPLSWNPSVAQRHLNQLKQDYCIWQLSSFLLNVRFAYVHGLATLVQKQWRAKVSLGGVSRALSSG